MSYDETDAELYITSKRVAEQFKAATATGSTSVEGKIRELETEVRRHEEKKARALKHLADLRALQGLSADPYAAERGGQVLVFSVRLAGQRYTFAAIRHAGHWYTTGTVGPQRVRWAQLVEWWARNNLQWVREYAAAGTLWEAPDA